MKAHNVVHVALLACVLLMSGCFGSDGTYDDTALKQQVQQAQTAANNANTAAQQATTAAAKASDAVSEMTSQIEALQQQLAGFATYAVRADTLGNKSDETVHIMFHYPVYFTGSGCTGEAYLSSSHLSRYGARQGFVFRADEPGQVEYDPSTYRMVVRGTEPVSVTTASTLFGPGLANCQNLVTAHPLAFVTTTNDEEETGVPSTGFASSAALGQLATHLPAGEMRRANFIEVLSNERRYLFTVLADALIVE
jgi:hypothetical protein